MAKALKIPGPIKGRITKLFKGGMLLADIQQKLIDEKRIDLPIPRIKTVLKAHFMKECDDLWRHAVYLEGGNVCAIGKNVCELNAHHLIGRGNMKFRWVVDNGVCLGKYRHKMANDMAAHGSTSATQNFASWMVNHRLGQWATFQNRRQDTEKITVTVYFLRKTAQRLEAEIEALKNKPKVDIMARKKV